MNVDSYLLRRRAAGARSTMQMPPAWPKCALARKNVGGLVLIVTIGAGWAQRSLPMGARPNTELTTSEMNGKDAELQAAVRRKREDSRGRLGPGASTSI